MNTAESFFIKKNIVFSFETYKRQNEEIIKKLIEHNLV